MASAPVFSASLIRSPAVKAGNSGLDTVTPPPVPQQEDENTASQEPKESAPEEEDDLPF